MIDNNNNLHILKSRVSRMRWTLPAVTVFCIALLLVLGALMLTSLSVPADVGDPVDVSIAEKEVVTPLSQSGCSLDYKKVRIVQIIDESVTQQPELVSIEEVNDPHFRSFITAVEDHVSSKFVGMMPCQENFDGEPMIKLVFVRLPLVTSGNEPVSPVPSLDAPQSNATCRVESPWLKLLINRSPSPQVRAVFIWNERQFLLDQVLLSGESPSLTTPLMPLTNRAFEEFAWDYAESEILRSPSQEHSSDGATVSERIPADVLWLFRHSGQSTLGPFSGIASGAMRETLQHAAESYTKLVVALVDHCFAFDAKDLDYKNIFDAADVISLEQYRIDQLH